MRRRWKVDAAWEPLGALAWIGIWIGMAIVGNKMTGGSQENVTWGFFAGTALAWSPLIVALAVVLWRTRPRRASEPVTTDLRETL